MNRILLLFTALLLTAALAAQDSVKVVRWSYAGLRQSEGNYLVQLKGEIAAGWKLFSR